MKFVDTDVSCGFLFCVPTWSLQDGIYLSMLRILNKTEDKISDMANQMRHSHQKWLNVVDNGCSIEKNYQVGVALLIEENVAKHACVLLTHTPVLTFPCCQVSSIKF